MHFKDGKDDTLLLVDQIEPLSGLFDIGDFRIGYFNRRSLAKETGENEDTLLIKKEGDKFLLAVSDGAGGHPRGRDASYTALKYISESKEHTLDAIDLANQEILGLKVGARSTLCMAKIDGNEIRFFTVGDSEILYWNAQGSELYHSVPQSPVGHKIEAELLHQSDSLHEADRFIVSNMLGDLAIRIEATTKFTLKKGHTILIGTDGLFDNLTHEQLTAHIGKGSFDKSFEEMVELCTNPKPEEWVKNDDVAFIAIRKIKAD